MNLRAYLGPRLAPALVYLQPYLGLESPYPVYPETKREPQEWDAMDIPIITIYHHR